MTIPEEEAVEERSRTAPGASGRRWPWRLAAGAGWILAVAAGLLHRTESTPVGVLLDARHEGLALSAAAATLLAVALWPLRRGAGDPRRLGVRIGGLVVALVILALSGALLLRTRQEEVQFHSGEVALAGTLFTPRGAGPHPAVVVIHGSGYESRREYAFYARLFARHGVAGLAYDKRGVGASTGDPESGDYHALARDVLSGVAFLRSRADIDGRRIGLLGVSEGEWVGAIAAVEAAAGPGGVAFLGVISPSATSPARQVLYEMRASLRAAGFGEEVVARASALEERLFEYHRTGAGKDALEAGLERASKEPWFEASELPARLWPPEEYAWWRSVMDFDPIPWWKRVACPVLLVSGGSDRNSPVEESQARIRQALAEGGNARFTGRIFPGADHAIVEWWLPAQMPPPRFPRGYPDLLVSWIRGQI